MPTALVTGANGFIGSHLVRELLDRGYEVRCLVRSSSDLSSLRGLPVTIHLGDVRDPESLHKPVQGVDFIFHLAAVLLVTSQEAFDETNSQGTANLLSVAEVESRGQLKRFLLVSSQAAVGPGRDATPLDESAELRPISWYGLSKKQAEKTARGFDGRLPVTIFRLSSVYGERERDISQAFPAIERGLHPKIGTGGKSLVMVYVGDVVRALVDAAESENTVGQTYHICHPEILSSDDAVKAAANGLGKPTGLELPVPDTLVRLLAPLGDLVYDITRTRPPITTDKAREVTQRFWVIDPAKAKREFGWEARYNIAEGMKKTVQSYEREQTELREMSLVPKSSLWLMFVGVGTLLGSLIEVTSALGRFYTFRPRWGVLVIVFGAFGLGLGTLAFQTRTRDDSAQLAAGTLVAAAVEALNDRGVMPGIRWDFAPGWPLGITNGWLRSGVLGLAGGGFVLAVNAVMRAVYALRLRRP